MDYMVDSLVRSVGINHLMTYNPITNIVVPFILVPKVLQKIKFQTRERTKEMARV